MTNEEKRYWWSIRSEVYHRLVAGLTNEACNADRARQRGGFREGLAPPEDRRPCQRCMKGGAA